MPAFWELHVRDHGGTGNQGLVTMKELRHVESLHAQDMEVAEVTGS